MSYLAVMGYILLISFVLILMWGKISPVTLFIALPIIVGLIAGYDPVTLNEYIKAGIGSTTTNAVMFCFAVLFFNIMSEAGLFEPIINFLIRHIGKNVVGICVAAGLVTVIGHLDESATTTICITVPFFLPLFKKLKMDPKELLLMIAIAMGVMNLLPWGGPMMRVSVATGLETTYLWRRLIPVQIAGLVCVLIMAFYFGKKAEKAGAKELAAQVVAEMKAQEQKPVDWKFFFNLILTIGTIAILSGGGFTSYIVFMISCSLALIVNFPGQKPQNAIIRKAAPPAFFIVATILASGVFVGILGQGEPSMLTEMANVLLGLLPESLGKYLHIIMGILSAPLGLVFGNDAYLYGVLPLCIEVGENYGITGEAMGLAMAIGKNVAVMGSPVYPSTFLLLGMADVELKDYLKYSFVPMWVVSILMILVGIVFGIIPLL